MAKASCVTTFDKHVGKRLLAARVDAGLSQTDAGDHLKITFQQVQKYENGMNRISAGKLWMLAQLYNKPVSWFFEGLSDEAGKPVSRDVAAELLSVKQGSDLARDFIAIKRLGDRDLVASMASRLAANGAGRG
jgi:transcriptional regulator with XRE-family HTH domain